MHMGGRKLWSCLGALALVTASAGGYWGWGLYQEHQACLRRGAALDARIERLKREANERLKIGTRKEDAVRFLKENGMSVAFYAVYGPTRIEGMTTQRGCVQIFGCGDEVTIVLDADVDAEGTVVGAPRFDERLMDCM